MLYLRFSPLNLFQSFIIMCSFQIPIFAGNSEATPKLLSNQVIWEESKHSAFTDLIEFQGAFYVVFRESNSHAAGDNGKIRILKSKDGKKFESVAQLSKKNLDLRDPKLSITPSGLLMLTAGGSIYQQKKLLGFNPQVSFSVNGKDWTDFESLNLPDEWPWRVTWHDEVGYTASYHITNFSDLEQPWTLSLMQTFDGKNYAPITTLDVPDAGETTLRFLADHTMITLVRRQGNGWIGTSSPPYTEWDWNEIEQPLGGPNFLILPNGHMWATSRYYLEVDGQLETYTMLAKMTSSSIEPVLFLPSGGDTSYAGMAYRKGDLYISYYSSHEGKSKIYLAKVANAD